jgi:hypothetical protein
MGRIPGAVRAEDDAFHGLGPYHFEVNAWIIAGLCRLG